MDAYYLLTLEEKDKVKEILTRNGFEVCTSKVSHETGFKFNDKGEIEWDNQVAISDGRQPTVEDDYSNPLSIAYACAENDLPLPETRIRVDGMVLERLVDTKDSKAIKALKGTTPYAVYRANPDEFGIDLEMMEKIEQYDA
jgi:hypothetical protein